MVKIEATCSLENFRRFIVSSTCQSYIPQSYLNDYEVFPEREQGPGSIYVEAADKVTLKKIREMTFVNAKDVLGVIYNSKSGNTHLRWRQVRKFTGKVTGDASSNTLVNLTESGVISQEWVNSYLAEKGVVPEGETIPVGGRHSGGRGKKQGGQRGQRGFSKRKPRQEQYQSDEQKEEQQFASTTDYGPGKMKPQQQEEQDEGDKAIQEYLEGARAAEEEIGDEEDIDQDTEEQEETKQDSKLVN